jgi:hypothetical protein
MNTDESTTAPTTTGEVKLDTPLTRGNQVISKVGVRKPRSGELRGVSLVALLQMDVVALQTVLPRITVPTLTKPEVSALEPSDLLQLGTEVSNFLLPKADRAQEFPTA